MSSQQTREECRREVRGYLAERQKLAFSVATIARRLRMENDFADAEVQEALVYLVGRGHATVKPDDDGATEYYQATSAGVLAHERRTA